MRIAVLGTGEVGRGHANALHRLGHDVRLGTRDPAKPVEGTDVAVVRFAEAVDGAEIVINAVNGGVAVEVLTGLADQLDGTVVIDLSNPLDFSSGQLELFVCNTDSLGERIQRAVPAARIVKTLSTANVSVQVDPDSLAGGQHDMFMAGNDSAAKAAATRLLTEYGWRNVVDLGDITGARSIEMMLPMWVRLYTALGTARFNYRIVIADDRS